MARRTLLIAALFILFLVQNTAHLVFAEWAPPVLLIAVVFCGVTEGPAFGLAAGIFAGLFPELFSVGKIGAEMFVLGTAGFISGMLATRLLLPDSFFFKIVWPPLVFYSAVFFHAALIRFHLHEPLDAALWSEVFLWPQFFLTVFLAPCEFFLLEKWIRGKRGLRR